MSALIMLACAPKMYVPEPTVIDPTAESSLAEVDWQPPEGTPMGLLMRIPARSEGVNLQRTGFVARVDGENPPRSEKSARVRPSRSDQRHDGCPARRYGSSMRFR